MCSFPWDSMESTQLMSIIPVKDEKKKKKTILTNVLLVLPMFCSVSIHRRISYFFEGK